MMDALILGKVAVVYYIMTLLVFFLSPKLCPLFFLKMGLLIAFLQLPVHNKLLLFIRKYILKVCITPILMARHTNGKLLWSNINWNIILGCKHAYYFCSVTIVETCEMNMKNTPLEQTNNPSSLMSSLRQWFTWDASNIGSPSSWS